MPKSARSGYFAQSARRLWASAKQAPANSVLNRRQGLSCLARFGLSYLCMNFRGDRLVLCRCDTLFNVGQGSRSVEQLEVRVSDNSSQRIFRRIPSVAQPAVHAPLRSCTTLERALPYLAHYSRCR